MNMNHRFAIIVKAVSKIPEIKLWCACKLFKTASGDFSPQRLKPHADLTSTCVFPED